MIIYRAINTVNNKSYIGKCVVSLDQRRKRHLRDAKSGSSLYFHRAIRKYGKNSFVWKIICICKSKNDMKSKERYFIKKFRTFKGNKGYNLTHGGDGGIIKHTQAAKDKIRLSKLGAKNPMYGVGHTLKVRLNMSKARRGKGNPFYGKMHGRKTILKMKENHIGMTGREHTDATKEKMSVKARGENNSQNKLSVKNIKEIKGMIRQKKIILREIACKFGVSRSLINNIKHERTWSWV